MPLADAPRRGSGDRAGRPGHHLHPTRPAGIEPSFTRSTGGPPSNGVRSHRCPSVELNHVLRIFSPALLRVSLKGVQAGKESNPLRGFWRPARHLGSDLSLTRQESNLRMPYEGLPVNSRALWPPELRVNEQAPGEGIEPHGLGKQPSAGPPSNPWTGGAPRGAPRHLHPLRFSRNQLRAKESNLDRQCQKLPSCH